MEDKAIQLAKEYRVRKKFPVSQTHIPGKYTRHRHQQKRTQ